MSSDLILCSKPSLYIPVINIIYHHLKHIELYYTLDFIHYNINIHAVIVPMPDNDTFSVSFIFYHKKQVYTCTCNTSEHV